MLKEFNFIQKFNCSTVLKIFKTEDQEVCCKLLNFAKYKILLEFAERHPLEKLNLIKIDKILEDELFSSQSDAETKKDVIDKEEGLANNVVLIGIAFLILMLHYLRLFATNCQVL